MEMSARERGEMQEEERINMERKVRERREERGVHLKI